jgi:hypothetical protein
VDTAELELLTSLEDHHWRGFIIAMLAVGSGLVTIALKLAGLPYGPGYASLLVTIAFP